MSTSGERLGDLLPRRSWLPTAVTAANIVAGFSAMLLAADGRFEAAVYLLFVAILLDSLDGRIARWLRATSAFGQQFDSFSDALSFGAAPAFLLHVAVLHRLGPLGFAVTLAYVLSGVFRLVRFNLLSNAHGKARRTLGIPIPIGAGFLMVLVLMREEVSAPWAALVAMSMAVGMMSRWRLPDLAGRGLVSAMLLVGLLNYTAIMLWPGWPTVIWWSIWNVLILLAARLEDRQLEPQTAET